MNTTAAGLLAAAIVISAIILVAGSERPTAPTVEPSTDDVNIANTSPGDANEPDLMGATYEARLAKLKRERDEARAALARRDRLGPEADPVVPEAPTAAEQAPRRDRFFALGKAYAEGRASDEEVKELLALAKDKDLMKLVVSGLQTRIEANPGDLEARLQLVEVQSARLHSAESITERSLLRTGVQEQLDEVLARDPDNWDARYMRAVGISHSQRSPQGRANAIKAFESLIAIQDGQARQPRFAKAYGELAGVLLQEKNLEKARATIEAGLAQYPDDAELKALREKLGQEGN